MTLKLKAPGRHASRHMAQRVQSGPASSTESCARFLIVNSSTCGTRQTLRQLPSCRHLAASHWIFTGDVAPTKPVTPGVLQAGVALRDISPPDTLWDTWTDTNGNGVYDAKCDTYVDRNGNGKFDPLWLSGFSNHRAATGIDDPLTARALALRNNGVTVVLVTLDAIGLIHNDCMAIREMVRKDLGIDHIVIAATHGHATPDPIGVWSAPVPILSFNPAYIDFLRPLVRDAVEEAVRNLQPVEMYCATAEVPEQGYVRDSRLPEVIDHHLYLARFVTPGTDTTVATFVNWGIHPESVGGADTVVTCDYPHWLRKGLEDGLPEPNGCNGFGGMCLFFQGALGGLMTQLELAVPDRTGAHVYTADSFEKAQALGEKVAVLAATTLRRPGVWKNETPALAVSARFFTAQMQPLFRLGLLLGLFHRGYYPGGKARSEIDVVRIGDVCMLCTPGELYPEIAFGGVVALPGRDYDIPPLETPPFCEKMGGRMNVVLGLANDFIGYIIPKSQWDQCAPYVYNGAPQYGEYTSSGPEIAPAVYREACEQLERMRPDRQ